MPVPGKNVNRSLTFFEKYGSIIKDGFTFEPAKPDDKAYEKMIKTGKVHMVVIHILLKVVMVISLQQIRYWILKCQNQNRPINITYSCLCIRLWDNIQDKMFSKA